MLFLQSLIVIQGSTVLFTLSYCKSYCVAEDDTDKKMQFASSILLSGGLMSLVQSWIGVR